MTFESGERGNTNKEWSESHTFAKNANGRGTRRTGTDTTSSQKECLILSLLEERRQVSGTVEDADDFDAAFER